MEDDSRPAVVRISERKGSNLYFLVGNSLRGPTNTPLGLSYVFGDDSAEFHIRASECLTSEELKKLVESFINTDYYKVELFW